MKDIFNHPGNSTSYFCSVVAIVVCLLYLGYQQPCQLEHPFLEGHPRGRRTEQWNGDLSKSGIVGGVPEDKLNDNHAPAFTKYPINKSMLHTGTVPKSLLVFTI